MKKISHQVHLPTFSSQSSWNRQTGKANTGGVTELPALAAHSLLAWRWVGASGSPALLASRRRRHLPPGGGGHRSRLLTGSSRVTVQSMHTGALTHGIPLTITYQALPDQLNKQVQENKYTFLSQTWLLAQLWVREHHFIINLLSPFPKWNLTLLSPE